MANVIKHKRGSGSDPVASDLVVGEVAIRTDVGKLFTKMDNGSVAEIAGGGSDIVINTLSSSSGTGGGSATFNGSAYRFTLSQPPSVSAQQLLVSINGVIQKPVAGTGQPSEGFSVDGTDIILGDAPATGSDFFILTFKSLGVSEPADNSVTSAKIVDGAIVNADINASAAIAGTKISPNFGSQAITTTGNCTFSDVTLENAQPSLILSDNNAESDFALQNRGGVFTVRDIDNNSNRFQIASNGNISVTGTVDGRDLATDGSKLDGIEASATADQTASEILTLIKTVDGTGSGLDADTLDGQEGSYYTNAANLTGTLPAIDGSNLTGINTDLVSDTSPQLGGTLDCNDNVIQNGFGSNLILRLSNGEKYFQGIPNGASELFYDGNKKLETISGGITVTGGINTTAASTFNQSTFNSGASAVSIAGGSDIRFTSGNWTGNPGSTPKIQAHSNYLYIVGGSNGIIFREDGTDRWFVEGSGHFRPASNNTYDIGNTSQRVRNIYTNDLHLSNEGSSNDVDGTWGSYTIQEGAEDLFLVNRRNGKKYKFNLTEVS